jgi:hypothetical protein
MKPTCTGALLALIATSPALANHPCSRIAEPARRLACFDQHYPVAAPAVAPAAAQPGPAAVAPVTAPAASAARFGLPPSADERPRELESISAVVREIGSLRHRERVFVLDNGQRWAERTAESSGTVNPGDRVTVERGSFGSFMLVTPAGVGLRVRRLP